MGEAAGSGAVPALQLVESSDRSATVARWDGANVVRCAGELDRASLPALLEVLVPMIGQPPDVAIVDLGATTFLDCGVIGTLVEIRSALRAAGSDLAVRSPPPIVVEVLTIAGLDDLLLPADTETVGVVPQPGHGCWPDDAVLSSWRSLCASEPYGSTELAFARPAALVAAVGRLVADPAAPPRPRAIASLLAAAELRSVVPTLAATQLVALNRVGHGWIDDHAVAAATHRRWSAALDGAVNVALTAVLDDMEQASLLDSLTGLLNRRAMDRDLPEALAAHRRHGRALTVVMIDVVGLKATNDRLGHAAGDDVLREVARALIERLRVGDNAYRIGGDEFVLLLPGLELDDVGAVMGRYTGGPSASITWGCASTSEAAPTLDRGGEAGDELLVRADRRLLAYRASGRAVPESDGSTRPVAGQLPT